MMNELPFAPASERNKHPVFERLNQILPREGSVLEIGAGTGQHAVFFAAKFPQLTWQASDRPEVIDGLQARIELEGPDGMPLPLALDVAAGAWPDEQFDVVYAANTAHIMSWPEVRAMFAGVSDVLVRQGCFCLYGPFKVDGAHTAPSNERFDRGLQEQDPLMGLRDLADIDNLAREVGLHPEQRLPTPANNFMLVFRRP